MDARIVNYRGGARTQYANQMVLLPEQCINKESAVKLIGKKVQWTTESGKKIIGKVVSPHGRNGAVLAHFNRGMPGQSLGTKAEIIEGGN